MTTQLLSPLSTLELKNRIVMAPMTRCRTAQPGNIPTPSMALYYAQRASAGLIISEATQISPQGQGYSFTPGIHSDAQIKGWLQVTRAVHDQGGKIFLQLWHVGRISHSAFHQGERPVAPSAINPQAQIWLADEKGRGGMVDCPTPRALSVLEIQQVIADYKQAAINAIEAGFDGVEIHGANGYLIDQFLRTTSNHRDDQYGGTRENRLRFLAEITDNICNAIGANKVGVRLAPYITARGMNCPDIIDTILDAAVMFERFGLAYLHLSEADWDDAPQVPNSFRQELRRRFTNSIIVAGGYSAEKGEKLLQQGLIDLVAFGRPFIANPDLVSRIEHQQPLSEFDSATLFGGTDIGYTDYTSYQTQPMK